jgi:ABC-type bacteriocin/lantibiotic exporter with double-glycine peptidase domain
MLIWTALFLMAPNWLDVPYVRQVEAGCGAASIAMIMQYWMKLGIELDPAKADGDRIYESMGSPPKGIKGQALKQYLEQQGFQTFIIDGEMQDLRDHLGKGRPIVVCLAPKSTRGPLHYVVVVGLSETEVTMHDPARGKLITESTERFLREWKTTGNWTLLAVPRQAR